MSCKSSCTKTSNNKYPNCPPRMDDGRHFTDYQPNCHLNNLMRSNNATNNSFQYRMFLTQNANKIMDINRKQACEKNCCAPCQPPYQSGTMMRETQADVSATAVPGNRSVPCGPRMSSDPTTVAHSSQPLSCTQWSVGNSNSVKNCCVPTQEAVNMFIPPDVAIRRLTSPGGGKPLQN